MINVVKNPRMWEGGGRSGLQNTTLHPRIGNSHGGLRNFAYDHPRIPPSPFQELELVMENFRIDIFDQDEPKLQKCAKKIEFDIPNHLHWSEIDS